MTSLVCLVALGAFMSMVSSTDIDGMHPKLPAGHSFRRNPDEELASYWRDQAQAVLLSKVAQPLNTGIAKNVIIFLGDGMSVPTLTAARALQGQRAGQSGEEAALSFEQFPYSGLAKTYCVDSQVPDSACTATAFLSGIKGNLGTIGVTAAVNRSDCVGQADTTQHVQSILRWSQDAGKATGIVTTSRITHSTPGGTYAHIAERHWESDIDITTDGGDVSVCKDMGSQLVSDTTGRQIKVLLGGGRLNLLPTTVTDEEGFPGRRQDQRNLIDEWIQDKTALGATSAYVWNRDQLLAMDVAATEYVLGLFESDHMKYHADADPISDPTLAEMTDVAIRTLQKEANGFFLLVEGARVDMAHHDNMAYKALDETLELAAAVEVAMRLTSETDTLLVVTGDHSHTMSLSGYGARGNDILGLAGSGTDQFPYATLSYANGPGYHDEVSAGARYNISQDDTTATDYKFPAMNPLVVSAHGGEDVTIHSRGPWAHLLSGTVEQNFIAHAMAYASCVGTGATACAGRSQN